MAGEFSFDDINLNFDSISHNGIFKCERCNMFVPYRSLAEHIQMRHKSTTVDYIDDGQSMLMAANQFDGSNEKLVFRPRAPRPKYLDSDFDTTDTESIVIDNKNQRNGNYPANSGAGSNTTALPNTDNRTHSGRTAVRGGDRYQAQRFAKLRAAREQQQAIEQKKLSNGNDVASATTTPTTPTATAASAAQSRRKIITASEMFSKNRSQSEVRTQKVNGFFSGVNGGGGGAGGNERGYFKKFGQVRRSASVQRAQVVTENFEHCKFCLNLMHKDYVEDHIRRRHQTDEPAADNNTTADAKETIVVVNADVNGNGGGNSTSSSDVSDVDDDLNGQSNGKSNKGKDLNGTKVDQGKNGKTNDGAKKTSKKSEAAADKHKGYRRCQFCEAFMHTDYLAGHLIRKHKTEYIGAGGMTWLKYSDEQMNVYIKEGRLTYKNGAFYITDA